MIPDGHLILGVTRGKEVRSGSKVLATYPQLARKREIRGMKLKEKRGDRVVAIVITRLLSLGFALTEGQVTNRREFVADFTGNLR